MWYLAVGLAARGWESHNLEIWWNSDSFFVSFEVTLSGSWVPGYSTKEPVLLDVSSIAMAKRVKPSLGNIEPDWKVQYRVVDPFFTIVWTDKFTQ